MARASSSHMIQVEVSSIYNVLHEEAFDNNTIILLCNNKEFYFETIRSFIVIDQMVTVIYRIKDCNTFKDVDQDVKDMVRKNWNIPILRNLEVPYRQKGRAQR